MPIAKVQKEFFQRVLYFSPRIIPCIHPIDTPSEGFVGLYTLRMNQWEADFVAGHGEHATQRSGHGGQRTRIVCGVVGYAPVINNVSRGHDGKGIMEYHGRPENGLVVGLACGAVFPAETQEVTPQHAAVHQHLYLRHFFLVVEKRVVLVPCIGDPPPRCPSPNAEDGGEEVARYRGRCGQRGGFLGIKPGNHPYFPVVGIAVEEFSAETEERLRGHIIVFEDDASVNEQKCPFL